MIVAKHLVVMQKNGYTQSYKMVTQIYTVGNFLTITGRDYDNKPVTDKFMIADLRTMSVSFDGIQEVE